jgi:hypothetical protein
MFYWGHKNEVANTPGCIVSETSVEPLIDDVHLKFLEEIRVDG